MLADKLPLAGWISFTAVDDVMIKEPPSGLILKVGKTSRKRWKWALTLVAQHYYFVSQSIAEFIFPSWNYNLIPITFAQSIQIIEGSKLGPALLVKLAWSHRSRKGGGIRTAFETTISSPPSSSIALLTTLTQSSLDPTSYISVISLTNLTSLFWHS